MSDLPSNSFGKVVPADDSVIDLAEAITDSDCKKMQMEYVDQHLDMALDGPPPPSEPGPALDLAGALQELKPALMHTLGFKQGDEADEAAWQEITEGTPELVEQYIAFHKLPRARDTWVRRCLLPALLRWVFKLGFLDNIGVAAVCAALCDCACGTLPGCVPFSGKASHATWTVTTGLVMR
jgi:hypothetical protein